MNIRTKLTLRFSLIVASILVLFSISIYLLSSNYRREEFFSRLESRALTTARLYVTVQEVDNKLLRIIDKNSIHAMFQEKVLVFNQKNELVYASLDDFEVDYSEQLLNDIRHRKKIEYSKDGNEFVGIAYSDSVGEYVVVASAYDRYGRSKLKNLYQVLVIGLVVGLMIAILTGIIFSNQVLAPLAKINQDVSGISGGNLSQRINEGNRQDEIAQLAMNFNLMLERIESAFAIQQQFVSNASHELRTPLTAISSQLQLLLSQRRTPEAYEKALGSLLDDASALVNLTNGLLNLAQSSLDKHRAQFIPVRVDETIYAAQAELSKTNPDYHFQMEYGIMPDEGSALEINGNETLLKTAFMNLMDNACKFSTDHTLRINLLADGTDLEIMFIDNGIGILQEDLQQIFVPFYRGSNVHSSVKGFGIGLSLCERIVRLHNGTITVTSEPGHGSTFRVRFPAVQRKA